jgi:hypothetical protein
MSFNSVFINSMCAAEILSDNEITQIILGKIKDQCYEIDKTDAFDNLLVVAEHLLSVSESGKISKNDQNNLSNLLSLGINQTIMIDERIEWYRTQLPEVNVSSFVAFHELLALYDIIIADGILNKDTEKLLVQIKYALDSIKNVVGAILTVV